MNREEIAAQVTQALDLIGCKYQVHHRDKNWDDPWIEVNAPGVDGFLITDLDYINFSFIVEDGSQRNWDIQITDHQRILFRIWSCFTIISARNVVVIKLPNRVRLNVELWIKSADELKIECVLLVVESSGEDIQNGEEIVKSADPDMVAAARSLLLGSCPQDVFLDLLCEKYDYINELRYATA